MNITVLVGRLTTKPELKVTPNGKNVCNFTIAVERKFKGANGTAEVDYIDCFAWEHNANFLCRWFDKGVRVAVSGELQTRFYEKDGKKQKIVEVLVSTVEFADGKTQAKETSAQETNTVSNIPDNDDFIPLGDADDLPFNV